MKGHVYCIVDRPVGKHKSHDSVDESADHDFESVDNGFEVGQL